MNIKKGIILLLVLSLSVSMLVACGGKENNDGNEEAKSSLESIKDKGKLIVGTSADYPPYEFHALIDGKDKIVGSDMSFANYIAEELGVELEIKEMDFKDLTASLPIGMIDLVIAGMNPSPERLEEVDFSEVYHKATHGVIIRKNSEDLIKTEDDLVGKKLGAQMGTVQEEIGEGIEGVELTSLPLTNNLIMELETERIDGIIMEKPVAEAYAKANENLMVVADIEFIDETGGAAVGIKKGDTELVEAINEIIKKAEDEGLFEEWIVEANKIQDEAGIQ